MGLSKLSEWNYQTDTAVERLADPSVSTFSSMAEAMVDSWQLATISMWVNRLNHHEVIKLIGDHFQFDILWTAAEEVNQLCKARDMDIKIPKNRDQGDQKDRVAVLGNALLHSLAELKARSDNPVFVVSSSDLPQVPGIVKDCVQAEPTVTARLDNIEKMIDNLSKGFSDLKASKPTQWPALQANRAPVIPPGGNVGGQGTQHLEVVGQQGLPAPGYLTPGGRFRDRSPSIKRSAEEAQLQVAGDGKSHAAETPWSQVVGRNQGRRSKPVQYGTAKVNVAGAEARPYDVVIGNTHPGSTEEIIKEVLVEIAKNMPSEKELEDPLSILEVECLTKPRTDGSRIWSKTWRVQVPNKFREYMQLPEAYPAGWTTRRYFPPRQQRPQVPPLYPDTAVQPPEKRPHISQ